mgnify:CR=1 FL=1
MSEPERKFTIKCNSCGSTNCEVQETYEYNCADELEYWGTKIVCLNCGEEDR